MQVWGSKLTLYAKIIDQLKLQVIKTGFPIRVNNYMQKALFNKLAIFNTNSSTVK